MRQLLPAFLVVRRRNQYSHKNANVCLMLSSLLLQPFSTADSLGAISTARGLGNVMNLVSSALRKYNPANTQITPSSPITPINTPTIAGPTKTGKPAPRFRMAIAAPLSFLTNEGTRAERGTYPASSPPQRNPQNHTGQYAPPNQAGE